MNPLQLDFIHIWACSSAGRAFGSHPRGREFESLQVHQIVLMKKMHSVYAAQKCGVFAFCDKIRRLSARKVASGKMIHAPLELVIKKMSRHKFWKICDSNHRSAQKLKK